jgi:hypothetical protein
MGHNAFDSISEAEQTIEAASSAYREATNANQEEEKASNDKVSADGLYPQQGHGA